MKKAGETTLIILPGWGGSAETWAHFVSLVSTEVAAVQVIELPCFGNEPCPNSVWGVEQYAAFVKEKIANIKGRKAILAHSFGGQVATYLVATSPELCDTLILSGAAIIRPRRLLKRVVFLAIAKSGNLLLSCKWLHKLANPLQKLLHKIAGSHDYAQTSAIKRDIFKKVIRQDMQHMLKHILCKSLVVSGTHDKYVPLKQSKRILAKLPNAELSIIQKGSHGLHHKKFANEFKTVIINFLN